MVLDNDPEIVEEYISGNRDRAANAFVRKYRNFVFSTALRFLENYDDADDCAQEVFIKALKALHKFRNESSLKTWLYRITTNNCINYKRKKKLVSFFRPESDDAYFEIPSRDMLPDEEIENREFEAKFLKALSELPKKQRETFALRYFDELPYSEISDMLGTSEGGLKANYYQAVQKLAKYLKEN